jgi:hypothetical protein
MEDVNLEVNKEDYFERKLFLCGHVGDENVEQEPKAQFIVICDQQTRYRIICYLLHQTKAFTQRLK